MRWASCLLFGNIAPDIPPAPTAISANSSTVIGASSLGFTMTELPAASAGAIFFSAMRRGWLNGYQSVSGNMTTLRNVKRCTP